MSEIVNESLRKIAKGTGIAFTGTIIGLLLGFVGRIILVRYTTQSEYGIYCLAFIVVGTFSRKLQNLPCYVIIVSGGLGD